MSDEERPESILNLYARHIREQRGDCPDEEDLIRLDESSLDPQRAAGLRSHVAQCGLCLTRLRVIEAASVSEDQIADDPDDWPEIERRGRERFDAFLRGKAEKEKAKVGLMDKIKMALTRPAFAYSVAVAFALLAAYGWFLKKPVMIREPVREKEIVEVEKPIAAPAISSGHVFSLSEQVRSGGGGSVIRLSPDETTFTLSFLVPVSLRTELAYEVEILDSSGRAVTRVAARPTDKLGNFLIVCNRELFPAGAYQLRVREMVRATQEERRRFAFFFSIEDAQVK